MKKVDPNIVAGLKIIRAAYTSGVYVGGSYSRHLVMPEYEFSDIDVFICGPRRTEQWVTNSMLGQLFDKVDNRVIHDQTTPNKIDDETPGGDQPYMMEHQHGRIICKLGKVKFDLIYIDTDVESILTNQTASSLSSFYHKVTYHDRTMLKLVDHELSRTAISDIIVGKECTIHKGRCTDAHFKKIVSVCKSHSLHLKVITTNNVIPSVSGISDFLGTDGFDEVCDGD